MPSTGSGLEHMPINRGKVVCWGLEKRKGLCPEWGHLTESCRVRRNWPEVEGGRNLQLWAGGFAQALKAGKFS